jgi:endogenous inhibitor of DNA gyrase (YacG/DUF329 family)
MATILPCPTCQRPVEWSAASRYRPFCCERCRLIDLGAWIDEKHAIPGEDVSGAGGELPGPDEPQRH